MDQREAEVKVIDQYTDVVSQAAEEAEGVSVRWLLTKEDGAPHFAMRVFDVAPGHSTPYHAHWWEHEVFVLAGEGLVCDEQGGETPLQSGSVVLVGNDERHCFRNVGDGDFRFICLIPHPELQEASC
jgi:quercetin dioxygenase-like cupin family protein